MTRWTTLIALTGAFLLGGCTAPLHLTYDHGRAYTAAFTTQTDLTRSSASRSYNLYGIEAIEIRLRVREETTDKESGQAELN